MQNRSLLILTGLISLVAFPLCQPNAQAQITFERLVDNNTAVPGQSFDFTGFSSPIKDGTDYVFTGSSNDANGESYSGLFRLSNGTITTLVEQSDLPGATTEAFIGNVDVNNGNYLFGGRTDLTDARLYLYSNGGFSEVAGPTESRRFDNPTLNGDGSITFAGGNEISFAEGIYHLDNGTLTTIANLQTPIPEGTGTFTGNSFRNSINNSFAEGSVAFIGDGSNGQQGLYSNRTGTLEKVFDLSDTIPGTSDLFGGMAFPTLVNDDIYFLGGAASGFGIGRVDIAGNFEMLVDTDTALPEGGGNFQTFGVSVIDGDTMIFAGGLANSTDLYSYTDGVVSKVVGVGDSIDGQTVTFVGSPVDFTDGSFSVNLRLDNSTLATYRIGGFNAVPEPNSLVVIGLATLAGISRRRRSH